MRKKVEYFSTLQTKKVRMRRKVQEAKNRLACSDSGM